MGLGKKTLPLEYGLWPKANIEFGSYGVAIGYGDKRPSAKREAFPGSTAYFQPGREPPSFDANRQMPLTNRTVPLSTLSPLPDKATSGEWETFPILMTTAGAGVSASVMLRRQFDPTRMSGRRDQTISYARCGSAPRFFRAPANSACQVAACGSTGSWPHRNSRRVCRAATANDRRSS